MPFPFVLSTTSQLSFQTNLTSSTHPSLPSVSTSQRAFLRAALKSHKRLAPADQSNDLTNLIAATTSYLKHLTTLDLALGGKPVSGEDVDIALVNEIEVEWRPTLSSSAVPGRESDRVKGRGLDFEIYFIHHTLALLHTLVARQALFGLYASATPTADQRLAFVQNATKSLRTAYSIHSYLTYRSTSTCDGPPSFPSVAADISAPVQVALQNLAQAELNLLAVLKDDPYPALLVQSRNKDDREWMVKAPEIPKVRAQVLRRLCVGAAEKAAVASAASKGEARKVAKDFIEYCDDLRRTATAKACRFAALDSDIGGETGKAIAWLRAGMNELGIDVSKDGARSSGLNKLKATWNEKRADRRIAKGDADWGADAGKAEESRILDYLDKKLTKENDTVNVQLVPEWKPLLATMPSGMVMPIDERWKPAVLEEDDLASMRGPPEDGENMQGDSSDEGSEKRPQAVGAFPGTTRDYHGASYY